MNKLHQVGLSLTTLIVKNKEGGEGAGGLNNFLPLKRDLLERELDRGFMVSLTDFKKICSYNAKRAYQNKIRYSSTRLLADGGLRLGFFPRHAFAKFLERWNVCGQQIGRDR